METGPTPDWTDAFPDVRQGAPQQPANIPTMTVTPGASGQPAQQPPVSPADIWQGYQDVRNQQLATGANQTPTYPTTGPTGDFWTDLKNRAVSAVTDAGVGAVSPLLGRGSWSPQVVPGKPATTPEEARANVVNTTGVPYYQGVDLPDRMLQAGATAGISALVNPYSIPAAIAGGMSGQAAQEALPDQPYLANLLGYLVGSKATSAISNLGLPPAGPATPRPGAPSQEDIALAQQGSNARVPVALGQVSPNPLVRWAYNQTGKLPFSGAAQFTGNVRDAWYRWVTSTFGENSDRLTGPLFDQAETRIGNGLNTVAQQTPVPMSNTLMTKLQTTVDNTLLSRRSDVQDAAMNLVNEASANNGVIDGMTYQKLTRRGGPIDNLIQSGDPSLSTAGIQLRTALDNELQNTAQASGNTAAVEALKTLRGQWKALQTVKPLSLQRDTSGGAPSVGEINPQNLQTAVGKNYSNAGTASPGDIPLLDAARFAQRFMRPQGSGVLPHIGTGVSALLVEHAINDPSVLYDPKKWAMLAGAAGGSYLGRQALQSPRLGARALAAAQNPGGMQFTSPLWQAVLQAQRPPFALAPPSTATTPQQP